MNEKLRNLLSDKDNIITLCLIFVLIIFLIITPFLPDPRPGRLRNELTKQGYAVEHIEFEFIKNVSSDVWVFQSSEPVFHDGYYVDYWQLTRRTFGLRWPYVRIDYSVEPYALGG